MSQTILRLPSGKVVSVVYPVGNVSMAGANSISRRQHLSWLFVFMFDVANATSIYSLLVKTTIHIALTSNRFILLVLSADPSGFAFFNTI